MERQYINIAGETLEIGHDKNYDIKKLIVFLDKAKNKGANFVKLHASSGNGFEVDNITFHTNRLETDAEFKARKLQEEIKYQKQLEYNTCHQKQQELALYKQLKAKYGKEI
jgi:hypothetical protein